MLPSPWCVEIRGAFDSASHLRAVPLYRKRTHSVRLPPQRLTSFPDFSFTMYLSIHGEAFCMLPSCVLAQGRDPSTANVEVPIYQAFQSANHMPRNTIIDKLGSCKCMLTNKSCIHKCTFQSPNMTIIIPIVPCPSPVHRPVVDQPKSPEGSISSQATPLPPLRMGAKGNFSRGVSPAHEVLLSSSALSSLRRGTESGES